MSDKVENECQETFLENDKNGAGHSLSFKDALKQILTACIAHSLVIQVGINMSFSSVLLPQLRESDSDIKINLSQSSWIASMATAALPLSALAIGPLMDKFGRKKMCILSTLPFILSWTLHSFATDVRYIYVARIVAGFGSGMTTVSMVYVSEISHSKYRPMLLTFNSVFVTMGILITCVFGFGLHWRLMVKIFLIFISLSLTALFFIPESPYWLLVFKNDKKGCAKSLRWIYTNKEIFNQQYNRILSSSSTLTPENPSKWLQFKENLIFYRRSIVWKPVVILLTIFLFQQLSAGYVIITYAVDIFRKIGGSFKHIGLIDEFVALILLGTIRFLMSIVLALISRKTGRRTLMFVSASGMIASSFALGTYMLASRSTLSEPDGTVAVILLLTYICFSSFGWLVIPWTLIGELLPVKVRGVLGGVMVAAAYVIMSLIIKVTPFVMESLGLEYIFLGLAAVNVFGLGYLYVFLPETLGKNFDEIGRYFEGARE